MIAPNDPGFTTAPSTNGDLVNRVQQLRLGSQLGAEPRGRRGSWLPWVLCGLLAVSWVGVGVRWYRSAAASSDDTAAGPVVAQRQPSSSASPDKLPPGEVILRRRGTLTPSLQIAVSPDDVSARVTSITFTEGKWVNEGETLATLWDARYRNEFETAQATWLSARARLDESHKTLESVWAKLVEVDLNRGFMSRTAARYESQNSSVQEVDQAKINLLIADARLSATERDVIAANARVATAERDLRAAEARKIEAERLLKNCVIKAPISGMVLTKKADKGSLVSPAAFQVATSLCEIADVSRLEVEMDVSEQQITRLLQPNTGETRLLDCRIVPDAAPDRAYRGRIDRVMPIADDSKNVVKVRVWVILPKGEKAGSLLRPKMSVDVFVYNRNFAWQPGDQKWE